MKPVTFTIDGGVEPKSSPLHAKIKSTLSALPDGRLLTLRGVAGAVGLSVTHVGSTISDGDFNAYRARSGSRFLYGSPRTIQLWLKAKQASPK